MPKSWIQPPTGHSLMSWTWSLWIPSNWEYSVIVWDSSATASVSQSLAVFLHHYSKLKEKITKHACFVIGISQSVQKTKQNKNSKVFWRNSKFLRSRGYCKLHHQAEARQSDNWLLVTTEILTCRNCEYQMQAATHKIVFLTLLWVWKHPIYKLYLLGTDKSCCYWFWFSVSSHPVWRIYAFHNT